MKGGTDADSSYSHILKYTGIFGGVQGLNILISLIRNKLVAVILGPAGMGLASLFNATVTFVAQVTNLGLSFSAVKNISEAFGRGDSAETERTITAIRSLALLTALVGTLVCAALGQFLNDFTFTWGDHTLHYIFLSPAVGLLAITGGETAILKGTRQLRQLALIQVYTVVVSLLISVPVYLRFGMSGIVPVIVLVALASMLLTIMYSYRSYPLNIRFSRGALSGGMGMIRLGVAYAAAAIMGSGAEFVIRSMLNNSGGLDTVGLYNAGYMMTIVYGGIVFSAMETDFFPRLSSANTDRFRRDHIINSQIEVSLQVISPLLVAFSVALPLLVALLFSADFMPVVAMVQITIPLLYMRALKLPVAYMTLARGDSLCYFLLEAYSTLLLVVSVVAGYHIGGLAGMGAGLLVTELVDLIVINVFACRRYGYHTSRRALIYAAQQLPVAAAVYVCVTNLSGWRYWAAGAVLFLISLAFTLASMSKKTGR